MKTDTMKLRPATMQDADRLLEWREDPETSKASPHTADLDREEYIAWLERILADPNRQLFIAEENGVPVGTVRADLSGVVNELSWNVAPGERNRGVATRMVTMFAKQIAGPIRAEINVGNPASARVAERAGMVFERRSDTILHYVRTE